MAACEFRIMDDNLAIKSATTVAGSSEDANFPASNMQSTFRARVWRSSGTFEIVTGTNDKIDFTDSSSTVAATLASGTYTATTLAAEMVTKMDAASVDAFTVTFSTVTGKWTLLSDGSTFELLNSSGTNAATAVLVLSLGFAASDLTGALTYTGASAAIHTVERLVFDIGASEDVDSVALMFPDTGSKLTTGAVIKVEANASDVWTSPTVSETLTYDDDNNVATHFFSSNQTYRFWSIEITDPTNSNIYVEAGGVILADATTLDHGPEIGFSYNIEDTSKITATDFGQEYADTRPNFKMFDFNIKLMPIADVNALANVYAAVGNVIPIAISYDSTELLFDKDRFFSYGKLDSDIGFKNNFRDEFDFKMTHRETF